MKVLRINVALAIGLLFTLACQKEIRWDEGTAAGKLATGANGECQPFKVSGSYRPGATLNDSNFVEVAVQVIAAGTYKIETPGVNGYSFKGSGTFSDSGTATIKLFASGKPGKNGTDEFTINYGGASCKFSVQVSDVTLTEAVFTLKGSPDQCMESTLAGHYFSNAETDTSHYVTVKVDVTTAGTYNLMTESVNGYFFSGSGVFLSPGEQLLTLLAEGTPVAGGDDIFTISTGTSSCTFTVNVTATVPAVDESYFPLTVGSYWSYEDLTGSGDTLRRTVLPDVSDDNGNNYALVEEEKRFGGSSLYHYRREGDFYYEYGKVEKYMGSLSYNTEVMDDINFLNQTVYKGTLWDSKEFSGQIQGGQVILIKYTYYCLEKNSTITFGGNNFANVNIFSMRPQVRSEGNGYNSTGEEYIYFYAKGIGIIYMTKIDHGAVQWEWRIKDWNIK